MKQMSESLRTGTLLAVVGGYLDAYTYTIRGCVFANAQTGNIALFGINMANGSFKEALPYLIPVFAFVTGILTAEKIRNSCRGILNWRQIVIILEIITLITAGFIPCGALNNAVNCMISFVCAVQVQSFKKINGNAVSTTVCTGNLRSCTEYLNRFFQSGDKENLKIALLYIYMILLFTAGAVIGAVITLRAGVRSVWLCTLPLGAVCAMLTVKGIRREDTEIE